MQSLKPSGQTQPTSQKGGNWVETTLGILYVVDGNVQFADDWDHWKNAFCRLLEISDDKARQYVEECVTVGHQVFGKLFHELPSESRLVCLTQATTNVLFGGERPQLAKIADSWGTDLQGAKPNRVYAQSISGDASRMVVGNVENEYAWLLDPKTQKPVDAHSIVYDTSYYSSGGEAHYGPKHYMAQADWRLEKSARLMRTVLDNSGERKAKWLAEPSKINAIDFGSGIGYFRKAFSDLGFNHFGIELSTDIIQKCKETFGYDTWHCDVSDLGKVSGGRKFHLITLWDVIEHLSEPVEQIRQLRTHLADDGLIVIRTPNVVAHEIDILGDFYPSFKFDHIQYFSPKSLEFCMSQSGLKPVYVETASHLFKGLLGADFTYKQGHSLHGADLIGIYAPS